MPLSKKPKRGFWQIHLSTVVLLVLIAGVYVGLNSFNRAHYHGSTLELQLEYGCPVPFLIGNQIEDETFLPKALAFDAGIGIAVVLFSAFAIEWRIRRREVRRK